MTIEITYNAHRYGDCSDRPRTRTRRFTIAGNEECALAAFYTWRRLQNERFMYGERKTYVGMLTGHWPV